MTTPEFSRTWDQFTVGEPGSGRTVFKNVFVMGQPTEGKTCMSGIAGAMPSADPPEAEAEPGPAGEAAGLSEAEGI